MHVCSGKKLQPGCEDLQDPMWINTFKSFIQVEERTAQVGVV